MPVVRHAIYWVPEGDLAACGAAWLGWDPETGREVPHPVVGRLPRPLSAITEEPRRYGLHATLKPPFRLAQERREEELAEAITAPGLRLDRIGRLLALVPEGDGADVARLAAAAVEALDSFRAPATEAELARRRAAGLDATEEANLRHWGYPYVMDRFRFHVTLTGPLGPGEEASVRAALKENLPPLPRPFRLDALAHVAEGEDGRVRLLHRYVLTG